MDNNNTTTTITNNNNNNDHHHHDDGQSSCGPEKEREAKKVCTNCATRAGHRPSANWFQFAPEAGKSLESAPDQTCACAARNNRNLRSSRALAPPRGAQRTQTSYLRANFERISFCLASERPWPGGCSVWSGWMALVFVAGLKWLAPLRETCLALSWSRSGSEFWSDRPAPSAPSTGLANWICPKWSSSSSGDDEFTSDKAPGIVSLASLSLGRPLDSGSTVANAAEEELVDR